MFYFFFQAEDGIRDYKVTGVQTCALPISHRRSQKAHCVEAFTDIGGGRGRRSAAAHGEKNRCAVAANAPESMGQGSGSPASRANQVRCRFAYWRVRAFVRSSAAAKFPVRSPSAISP